MPAESTYLLNKRRDWFDNAAYPTALANVYLALYTSATGPGAEGTEVTGGTYSRTAIPAASIVASAGNGKWTTNAAVNTAIASAAWGTVTHVALHDAATAGNRLAYAQLAAPRTVGTGQRLVFATGAIVWDASAG